MVIPQYGSVNFFLKYSLDAHIIPKLTLLVISSIISLPSPQINAKIAYEHTPSFLIETLHLALVE